jgi:hypothetical protein
MNVTVLLQNSELVLQLSVSASGTVGDLARAIETATGVPVSAQQLQHNGAALQPLSKQLTAAGVSSGDLVLCSTASADGGASRETALRLLADGSAADPEAFQRVLREDPALTAQIDPRLRAQLLGDAATLQSFLRTEHAARSAAGAADAEKARLRDEMHRRAEADPFDAEAQRFIEGAARRCTAARHMPWHRRRRRGWAT